MRRIFFSLFFLFCFACGTTEDEVFQTQKTSSSDPALAEGVQAGVIVFSGDAQNIVTYFVTLSSENPTVFDALIASGADLTVYQADWGNFICAINGVGYSLENCFNDMTASFWGFFILNAQKEWEFSQVGATQTFLKDGDIIGFSFSPPDENFVSTLQPPKKTLLEIYQLSSQ